MNGQRHPVTGMCTVCASVYVCMCVCVCVCYDILIWLAVQ